MTQLPTREDGGIDWSAVLFEGRKMLAWKDAQGKFHYAYPVRFAELVQAHTIERCAKVLENGRFLHDQAPAARLAREAATAIRKLEP